MKARTIYPPYAWAIFHGLKWYETLPHCCNIRGRIAIHAAAGMPTWSMLQFLEQDTRKCALEWLNSLPRGVILGTVEIIDCLPVEQVRTALPEAQLIFGDYSDGRYAAKLANPILFSRPIPAKGKQGWWDIELSLGSEDDWAKVPAGTSTPVPLAGTAL